MKRTGKEATLGAEEDWTWPCKPSSEMEFNQMMESVDKHLAIVGVPPFRRGLSAARLVAIALDMDIAFAWGTDRDAVATDSGLGVRILNWFQETYGERNKVDFSVGSVVMQLQGSMWRVKYPLIYGRGEIFISRDLSEGDSNCQVSSRPFRANVLRNIEHLTQARANRLSNLDLGFILNFWLAGKRAIDTLNALQGHELFDVARSDYALSVDTLMAELLLHNARWNTAQTAEKIIKGMLALSGKSFPTGGKKGHDIVHLGELLNEGLGIVIAPSQLRTVMCPPAVRYGEISVDTNEAWTSHNALVNMLLTLAPHVIGHPGKP